MIVARPEVLFVSCCGFSIPRSLEDLPTLLDQVAGHDLPCIANGSIYVLDGSAYLSRPGPRLVDALELMAQALHAEVFGGTTGLAGMVRVGMS